MILRSASAQILTRIPFECLQRFLSSGIYNSYICIEFSVFLNSHNILVQYTNLLRCHLCGSVHYAESGYL